MGMRGQGGYSAGADLPKPMRLLATSNTEVYARMNTSLKCINCTLQSQAFEPEDDERATRLRDINTADTCVSQYLNCHSQLGTADAEETAQVRKRRDRLTVNSPLQLNGSVNESGLDATNEVRRN